MSQPPLNTDKTLLESSVARAFNSYHRLAYAHIDADLTVVQTSDNFSFLLPDEMKTAEGSLLTEMMEEFVGAEKHLEAVANKEREAYILEHVNRETAEGDNLYFNFRVVNLHTLCAVPGLLLIVEDVTPSSNLEQMLVQHRSELRLAQEALSAANAELTQVNQFKSFLLSMLAHDMRTPLAAIRGYAELLLRLITTNRVETLAPKAIAFADNICNITDQMTWLIRDIIDLDQSEKGLLTISSDNCNIHAIIRDTIQMMDSMIKLQSITLLLELNPPDPIVTADSQRVRQIMNNLIGSAIKQTPSGGEVAISTHLENGEVVLVVADTGQGLTAEQTEALFHPHYRTKEARSSNILGSGLGLYIVKSLVEAQNGRIDVDSEIGRGTIFTVHLPLSK